MYDQVNFEIHINLLWLQARAGGSQMGVIVGVVIAFPSCLRVYIGTTWSHMGVNTPQVCLQGCKIKCAFESKTRQSEEDFAISFRQHSTVHSRRSAPGAQCDCIVNCCNASIALFWRRPYTELNALHMRRRHERDNENTFSSEICNTKMAKILCFSICLQYLLVTSDLRRQYLIV